MHPTPARTRIDGNGTATAESRVAILRKSVRRQLFLPLTALALSFGLLAWPAAQADVLLSNLAESDTLSLDVGTTTQQPDRTIIQAIRFQTGSSSRGYNITSIKAVLTNASDSDGVRVRIFSSRSNGTPYLSLYTLSNPATISDGTMTFTAPTSATLRKDAPYFVVFDSTAEDTGNHYEVRGTESESLTSMATGWSLNTDRHVGTPDSLYWSTSDEVPLVEINGDALVQANDANLSALSLSDGTPRFVTVVSPNFDSSMTSYTSSAAPLIDQITIKGTANNADGATVAYLDGDDQVLADADADTEGFQVDLEVGANTIKVRVTAEDGSTTRTYTLVVTRSEPLASPDALLSNLDEPNVTSLYAGTPTRKIRWTLAVGFETGSNEGGYTLNSVKGVVSFNTASSGMRVRIFSSSEEGRPLSSLYKLSSTANNTGVRTFEAPADATLKSDTSYFVVFDTSNTKGGKYYKLRGTSSSLVNSEAAGWSLDTDSHTQFWSAHWTANGAVPFVEINGDAIVLSSDATLSGLDLTWDDDGTENDIALSPPFDAAINSYTASVAHGVDQVTIKATKGDSAATVLYFDGADSALTDADGNADGFQVGLGVGTNTIKVKVAASDGETTQTYGVVVTRAADVTAPTSLGATVNGDALVITFGEALAAAANLANGAFSVKKTPSGGSEESVALTGSPSVSGATVTLTLAAAVVSTDTVTVSYIKPTSGTGNRLQDANGNEVASFSGQSVTNNTDPGTDPITVGYDPASYEVDEDAGSVTLTVSLGSHPADGAPRAFALRVSTSDGSADSGDYGSVASELIEFGIGDTSRTHSITILDDTLPEDDETFGSTLSLSSGSDVTVPAATATVTILANDPDNTAPTVDTATVNGASLMITFDETLTAAANLANGAFTLKKTPSGGSEEAVPLTGAPSIDGARVTLTLATAVVSTDADVKVGYTRPTTGTDNTLGDANGNEVADFADLAVSNETQAAPTLTASFENAPAAHDGTSVFTLDLVFSEAVFDGTEPFDRNQTIQDALQVTGGAVVGRRRAAPAQYDRWILRIRPSGNGGVTVTLPPTTGACGTAGAICTPDGVKLSGEARETVPGPPAEAPDAPPVPTLTSGTNWIEASWTAPDDNGSAITGYDVHYRETGGNWQDAGHSGTGTTLRITGLTADTAHEVRVRASNSEGSGDWSPAASGRTEAEQQQDGASEGDVRLVGGGTDLEGRVEIYHSSEWGTVCDDRFVDDDAGVVCRQLGYTGGEARTRAAFGEGTGRIWMDDVQCAGGESRLADCPFGGWGLHNCRHSEDVGVSCGPAAGTSTNSLTLSGTLLRVRFDRALEAGSVPSPGDFVVAAGTSAIPVASVAVVGDGVLLELSRPAGASERLTLSYLPAAMHPLRDTSLNPVPELSGQPVRQVTATAAPSPGTVPEVAAPPGIASWDPRAKLEVLDLSSRGLADLHDLSALADLERLDLGGNRVSDLWPLSPIAGLEELDLSGNAVSDLAGLGALTNLRALDLSDNQVSDLSPLASLTLLRRLDLSGNLAEDLSPLSDLRGLEVLLLDGNRVSNPAPLWNLPRLVHLSLRHNGVADAAMLRELRSLRRLDLSGNRLRDVWVLGDLPNLVFLGLSDNPVSDVSPLGRLTHLRWLAIDTGAPAADARLPGANRESVPLRVWVER